VKNPDYKKLTRVVHYIGDMTKLTLTIKPRYNQK